MKISWVNWFALGFVVVFVAILFLVNQFSIHPSGQFVIRVKLWQFYMLELQRLGIGSTALGPANGGAMQASVVLCQHAAIAGVGGVLFACIGSVFNFIGKKRSALSR